MDRYLPRSKWLQLITVVLSNNLNCCTYGNGTVYGATQCLVQTDSVSSAQRSTNSEVISSAVVVTMAAITLMFL